MVATLSKLALIIMIKLNVIILLIGKLSDYLI
jgi:hypothetical protein